ncbi:hypothetical protein Cus16_1704 [Curtobacterium sp. ER1/6]|nr:hypothetical protein Cus16_1704 [Curtobacterium sp. ER1/6]
MRQGCSRRLPLGRRAAATRAGAARTSGRGGCRARVFMGYSGSCRTRFRRHRVGFPPIHRCQGGTSSPQPVPPLLFARRVSRSAPGRVAAIRVLVPNRGQTCPRARRRRHPGWSCSRRCGVLRTGPGDGPAAC